MNSKADSIVWMKEIYRNVFALSIALSLDRAFFRLFGRFGKDYVEESVMSQAIDLARKGIGYVNPNPLVGAIVVNHGKIVGQGYHQMFGGPHAEVYALSEAGTLSQGATLYVTLEPCCHYGKTPPCTQRIIEAGVKRVVIGMEDPNPKVSGQGISQLRDAGIQVQVGVLEARCRELNKKFIHYITTGMPYVLYKSAMSLDGKTATAKGESQWISCGISREKVQQLRQEYAAIMVGSGTLFTDNPRLTCRLDRGRNPIRILLDARLQIQQEQLALTHNGGKIMLFVGEQIQERPDFLKTNDVEVIPLPLTNGHFPMKQLLQELGSRGIDSVLFEGGATLAGELLKEHLIQEILFFYAPVLMGDRDAPGPFSGISLEHLSDAFPMEDLQVSRSGIDIVVSGKWKGEPECLQA